MKKLLFIGFLLLVNIININATTGLLKNSTIIECDGILYGAHSKDNHYHKAEKTEKGNFKAVGDSLGTDWKCTGEAKDPNENKILEKVIAKLEKCVDGDTAVFNIDGETFKFRFLGIDTPETVHPTKEVEAYGKNASEFTCNKLKKADKIEIEYEEEKTDKYGRSLGWIWVDDSLLQNELISAGYAEVAYIYGNYKYTYKLCETQKEAVENNKGIWEDQKREEGYCSTIRTVIRNKKNNEVQTKKEENENQENEEIKKVSTVLISLIAIVGTILKIKK